MIWAPAKWNYKKHCLFLNKSNGTAFETCLKPTSIALGKQLYRFSNTINGILTILIKSTVVFMVLLCMALKRAHSTSSLTPTKKKSTGSGFVLTSTSSGHSSGPHQAQITRVVQGKSRQIDLNNGPPLVEYPPLDIIWIVFGDNASTQFLKSSPTLLDYERNVKYFHGRLALVVRGLNLDEILVLHRATLPAWTAYEKKVVIEDMCNSFELAYDWAQECLISKIKAYANLWFKSESGT